MNITPHIPTMFKYLKQKWRREKRKEKSWQERRSRQKNVSKMFQSDKTFSLRSLLCNFYPNKYFSKARLNSKDNPKNKLCYFSTTTKNERVSLADDSRLIKIKNLCRIIPLWELSRKNFRTTIFSRLQAFWRW